MLMPMKRVLPVRIFSYCSILFLAIFSNMTFAAEWVEAPSAAAEFDLLCEYRFLAQGDVQHTVYFSQVSPRRLSYRAGVILYVIDFDNRSSMLGLLPDTDEELSRETGTLQRRC